MFKTLRSFALSETGTIMVDWVVLTASIVGLAMVVILSVGTGVEDLADSTATRVSSFQYD